MSAHYDRLFDSPAYRVANSRHEVTEQNAEPDREQAGELSVLPVKVVRSDLFPPRYLDVRRIRSEHEDFPVPVSHLHEPARRSREGSRRSRNPDDHQGDDRSDGHEGLLDQPRRRDSSPDSVLGTDPRDQPQGRRLGFIKAAKGLFGLKQ